jgi:hypothetical protein
MECVRFGQHFGIFNLIFPVAIQAYFGRRSAFFRVFEVAFAAGDERLFVITGMMMTVVAGNVVPGGVLRMLEENTPGSTAILDADRFIRGFGGKSGVTEKTYDKENDGHAIDQLQISL